MNYVSNLCLLLAFFASSTFASEKSEMREASTSLRQLAEKNLRSSSASFHTSAKEFWTQYSARFAQLAKVDVPKLSNEELEASVEVFAGMASVGAQIPRSSNLNPAVKETAEAALASFIEISSRRKPTFVEAAMTYSAIFGLREWELEARMRSALGPLQNLPHIVDDPGLGAKRSLWYLDPDLLTMKRVAFEPTEDVKWIVIALADCPVAREAIADITSDSKLAKLFTGRSLWITAPGPDAMSFPSVFVWNAKYPQFAIKFIHHWDEWPMLDIRPDSPTFIRIENDRVVGVHSGWGTGEHLPRNRKVLIELDAKTAP